MDLQENFSTEAELDAQIKEALQPTPTPPFAEFQFDPTEVLLIYQALRLSLRNLSQQEQEPLDSIDKVTHLMRVIKPAATQASQMFAAQQQQGGQ